MQKPVCLVAIQTKDAPGGLSSVERLPVFPQNRRKSVETSNPPTHQMVPLSEKTRRPAANVFQILCDLSRVKRNPYKVFYKNDLYGSDLIRARPGAFGFAMG
jgi:hypothetical protein